MKTVNVLVLQQSNCCKEVIYEHVGGKLGCCLKDGYQIFLGDFINEVEFLAKDHPLVQGHPIALITDVFE